jgi:hypothetical protein
MLNYKQLTLARVSLFNSIHAGGGHKIGHSEPTMKLPQNPSNLSPKKYANVVPAKLDMSVEPPYEVERERALLETQKLKLKRREWKP